MKKAILVAVMLLSASASFAQRALIESFKPAKDTLSALAQEHFGVKSEVNLWKAMKRGSVLDLYFSRNLADYPWRPGDIDWFKKTLREFWPEYRKHDIGEIFCNNVRLSDLPTPGPGNGNGKPQKYKFDYREHKTEGPFIEPLGVKHPTKGLYRRNIALWQSHGLYFDGNLWSWQRTPLFRTVEDLYTQSYVLPFLIPMLENAGAYVMTPRERDTATDEVICDNNSRYSPGERSYAESDWACTFPEPLSARKAGRYQEKGSWTTIKEGFADFKEIYTTDDNPFRAGTARAAKCAAGKGDASIRWTPVFEQRGPRAVYISYKTVEGSTKSAHYTVHHMGGESEFAVDQTKGGGTWIYLGTFEFDAGEAGYVTLDNGTPKGRKGGKVVTADAVRFGGGIGKIARGKGAQPDSTWTVSGMPSYTEGALYWMQWAGAPQKLWTKWDGDYTRDYAGRGAWVKWMKDDLGIPVDLSLALHTDAGLTPNDSIVGTLMIYTLLEDNSRKYKKNSQDRMAARFYGDCVQSEVTGMIQRDYDTLWRRRQLWDRSYSECRTTDVPGIILELLSHQNFADMKYGMDPQFRFDVCRAVYKGMLKFLSSYYGVSYVVQPLPVKGLSSRFEGDGQVRLAWTAVTDPTEPTAAPESYIVYTRVDGGGWDDGVEVKKTEAVLPVTEGHIHSYKVVAINDGGCSFPSEIISCGKAPESKGNVLVVNNFDRVSGPSFFDTPIYAGFDDNLDGGVAWGTDISFIGEDYEHRRNAQYISNNAPGFGGSDYYFAGRTYVGNTFDYPYVHGKALMQLGYSFFSSSGSAICSSDSETAALSDCSAVDIICGKQVSTIVGTGMSGIRFQVFPERIRNFVTDAAKAGKNIIVSGADIATDAWDSVYPISDPAFKDYQDSVKTFITNTLGFKWISSRASRDGVVLTRNGKTAYRIFNERNERCYAVENPDGIRQSGSKGRVVLKYKSSGVGAGVHFDGGNYRVASYGFPLETLQDPEDMKSILAEAFHFFFER